MTAQPTTDTFRRHMAALAETRKSRPAQVDLLGCSFAVMTERDAVERVFAWRNYPRRKSHTMVTVNVAILMMMRSDPKLAEACNRADLVVADGKPLVWLSKLLGRPLPERVSGVDVMARLLEEGKTRGLRIFLLGAKQECVERLVAVVNERYPGVTVAGYRNGYFGPHDYAEVAREVRESRADVLFVGMPAPFKEIWCEAWREELATPTILGVGGAFDVLAGFVPRAPKWMQEAGLEWSWRLMQEPRKLWKRYLTTNARFLLLAASAVAKRGH
jgi:N-acetylglucosaminyldiphosphoundecaprenol N-acetyl-beta-D-mannosaminyltransferase